jgi:hypothetical protein
MTRAFAHRTTIVFVGVLSASSFACAADRSASQPAVVVRDVGQSRVILPTPEVQAPYAMAGSAAREADAWERQGHWIDVGQGRVYIPASR